jgi:hypothetical protein
MNITTPLPNKHQQFPAILNLNVRDASENKRRAFSPEK